jgi:hypothetical protein
MAEPLTTRTAAGKLETYDGTTLGWLIVTAAGAAAAARSMQFVSEVVAEEIDGAEYERGEIDVIYEQVGEQGQLKRDGAVPSTDTTGTTPGGVWFFDQTGVDETEWELVTFLPSPPGPGSADWDIGVDIIAIAQPPTTSPGGGASALADLTDVDVAALVDTGLLVYNEAEGKWQASEFFTMAGISGAITNANGNITSLGSLGTRAVEIPNGEGVDHPGGAPYVLVGGSSTGAANANHFATPVPTGLAFPAGMAVLVEGACPLDASGETTYMEYLSHPTSAVDFDKVEVAHLATAGTIQGFAEYARIGDPVVSEGEYAAGRIFTSSGTTPVGYEWGKKTSFLWTVECENGDGVGVVTWWVPTLGTPGLSAFGRHWVKGRQVVLDEPTSIQIDDEGEFVAGYGFGDFAFDSIEVYQYDGTEGALELAIRAADVQLDGTIEPPDIPGQTWTPAGTATVVDPPAPSGGGIAAGGDATTLWLGDQAAYDAIGSPDLVGTVYVVLT